MRVAYVADASPVEGNANHDIYEPFKGLAERGAEIHLLLRGHGDPRDESIGDGRLCVHPIFPDPPQSYALAPVSFARCLVRLREIRPDVLATAGDQVAPLLGYPLSKVLDVPWVVVLRAMTLEYTASNHESPVYRIGSAAVTRLVYWAVKRADHLFSITEGIEQFYRDTFDDRQIQTLGLLSLDVSRFDVSETVAEAFLERRGIDPDDTLLTYNGRLDDRNLEQLIETYDHVLTDDRDLTLVLTGQIATSDRTRKEHLEALTSGYDLEPGSDVLLLDWVAKEHMPLLLSQCDICIDPDTRLFPHSYAPSNKLLEWLTAGCAVVVPDTPGHAAMVESGVDGLLYQPQDYAEQTEMVEQLLEDDEYRATVARRAAETATEFDVEPVVDDLRAALHELV